MDEYKINLDKGETVEIVKFDIIQIKQNEFKYDLNIKIKENIIYFNIKDDNQLPYINYKRSMSFNEIKELNVQFHAINSFKDFYDYLKSLSNNNKLNIKKSNNKISIIWNLEVLLKQQSIEIDLFNDKIDLDLIIKEMFEELKNTKEKIDNFEIKNKEKDNKINDLTNEIEELRKEIKNLKNEGKVKDKNHLKSEKDIFKNKEKYNKESFLRKILIPFSLSLFFNLFFSFFNSSYKNELQREIDILKIMNEYGEGNFIFNEIEKKINKRIKRIKKLYQATVDGGDTINFHNKCDNIPNTLVIILSEGHRRFGGFTPIPWKSYGGYKKDEEMKTFVFSLDNKKIYNLKNKETIAVYHHCQNGPCFGYGNDIGIVGNPIKENKLFTYQSSYDYGGRNQSLSEYKEPQKLKALEYEVFQIIFS